MCVYKNSHLIPPDLLGCQNLELMFIFPGNQKVRSKVGQVGGFPPCILLALPLCLILPSSSLPCYTNTELEIKWYNN